MKRAAFLCSFFVLTFLSGFVFVQCKSEKAHEASEDDGPFKIALVDEFVFQEAGAFSDGLASVQFKDKWGCINNKGEVVIPFEYENKPEFQDGYAIIYKDRKYGCIDRTGRQVVPPQYEKCSLTSAGLLAVGEVAYTETYFDDYFWDYYEEDVCKWGFIDLSGKEVVPLKYLDYQDFSEGIAVVKQNSFSYGYIDKTGKEIVPLKYSYCASFKEGLGRVEFKRQYGFVDKTGKEVIPPRYDDASSFSEGLARVESDGKYGFVDKTGKEAIPVKYQFASDFNEGLAPVKTDDGMWGYVDKTGKEVVPPKYDNAYSFSEGLGRVKLNGKYGFVDKTGKEVVPPRYDDASSFSEGFALVESDGRYGFVDKTGKEVVSTKYKYARDFKEGLAVVGRDGQYGFIDKTGKDVVPSMYDKVYVLDGGFVRALRNGKWGVINAKGQEVLPFIFDEILSSFENGYAAVRLNGRYGFVDKEGNPLRIQLDGNQAYYVGIGLEKLYKRDDPETRQNLISALGWYSRAADKGYKYALFQLGYHYYVGEAVEKNYAEAVKWLEKCIIASEEESDGSPYLFLGYCYSEGGYGIEADDEKAFECFSKGEKFNNDGCEYALAVAYFQGIGCEVDLEKAVAYSEKLYAKNQNDYSELYAACLNRLAYSYSNAGEMSRAMETIDKAISLFPAKEELYDSKGEFYLKMGKEQEALRMWKKVLEINPDFLTKFPEGTDLSNQLKEKALI